MRGGPSDPGGSRPGLVLDVEVEGEGRSKMPPGLWLGAAGGAVPRHRLLQENCVRQADKGLVCLQYIG